MRSLLFVPGDNSRKLEKSLATGADALIIDLEDSVAAANKPAARALVRDFVAQARRDEKRPRLIVRVNPLDGGLTDDDVSTVAAAQPDAIMLPKSQDGGDVQHLSSKIAVAEARHGLADGSIRIIPIATETASAIFGLSTYAGCSPRLDALTWGAEDLSADVGGEANRDSAGAFSAPYRLARNLLLFAAASARVAAIDTVYVDFKNDAGLKAECEEARRDGFVAKMAIHPAQVAIINEVFTPDEKTIARAERIVAAFAENPGLGVVGMDGEMVDRPHLLRAQRTLARATAAKVSRD
ncbi:CoA ester lyase [Terrarubrum flagellatum]|uniref:HpcH/HpaI aldolase/citrate lyase family protein n=1 Tax=Terrirubrum flagellatum TaxID=2895980 RepID=UPI003144D4F4